MFKVTWIQNLLCIIIAVAIVLLTSISNIYASSDIITKEKTFLLLNPFFGQLMFTHDVQHR